MKNLNIKNDSMTSISLLHPRLVRIVHPQACRCLVSDDAVDHGLVPMVLDKQILSNQSILPASRTLYRPRDYIYIYIYTYISWKPKPYVLINPL